MGLLALLLALALTDAPDAGASDSLIRLSRGTQQVLDCPDLTGVAVGAPGVLDVRPLGPKQLLLVGLSAGESGLLLFHRDGTHAEYHVTVRSGDPDSEFGLAELRQTVRESPRLTLRFVGERAFAEGLLGSEEDFYRLREFYPSMHVFADFDPELVRHRVDEINDALARKGLRNARAVLHGGELLLIEGEVSDEAERHKAELIAQAIWGPLAKAMAALREHKAGAPAP